MRRNSKYKKTYNSKQIQDKTKYMSSSYLNIFQDINQNIPRLNSEFYNIKLRVSKDYILNITTYKILQDKAQK